MKPNKAGCSIIVAVMRKFVLLLPLIYIMPQLMADKTMAVYTAVKLVCFATAFLYKACQFRHALL